MQPKRHAQLANSCGILPSVIVATGGFVCPHRPSSVSQLPPSRPVIVCRSATRPAEGVDVSIDLVGTAATMGQAVRCLGVLGRAAIVALSREALSFPPYSELINKEAEVIGISDHLASELPR